MESGIVTNWSRTPPPVPWVIIVISTVCLLEKLVQFAMTPMEQHAMISLAGAVPQDIAAMLQLPFTGWFSSGLATLFTSLFVHSGWLHLAGNMAYLWVFGIPVEQKLGAFFMAAVFFLGGTLAHIIVALRLPELATPVIGASGAVSAVVGAYLGLFPRSKIGLFLPLGLYLQFAHIPALLVIGSWFTLQLVYSAFGPISGAVAWWTHLAGFAMGLVFALMARALAQFRV